MSRYSETFKRLQPNYDPRHIEAFVRLERPTLGSLSERTLKAEARIAARCVDEGGLEGAERLARSFGL